jgi:hypothetical protein
LKNSSCTKPHRHLKSSTIRRNTLLSILASSLLRLLSPLHRYIPIIHSRRRHLQRRNLLPQEIQILLAILEIRLCRGKLRFQQCLRFIQGISEHHVGAEPEVHFGGGGDGGFGVEGVVEFEGCFYGVGVGLEEGLVWGLR